MNKVKKMSGIIFECTAHYAQEGCAHIEVHIQLSKASTALTMIPDCLLRCCLVAIPSKNWWLFKWYCLAAVHMIIKNLYHSKVRDRRSDCAIGLGAIIIWILNGLYHSPDNHFLTLVKEVCQHVPANYDDFDADLDMDDPDAVVPLMFNAGLYFFCDIVTDDSKIYWLPFHKAISDRAIMEAFNLSLGQTGYGPPDEQSQAGSSCFQRDKLLLDDKLPSIHDLGIKGCPVPICILLQ
ncbi:hypothetical protein EDD15DRAFT_2379232 [Pisolithus albus]|nr:hypothetical protein EDD15DRAFT_2379232 [Pisolithus albus]